MTLNTSNVDRVVHSVFDTLFGEAPRDRQEPPMAMRQVVWARVKMAGAWEGEVLLEVPHDLAQDLAASLLEVDASALTHEQVLDTVGEMANMIAGNLKPLMPGARLASVPQVAEQILAGRPEAPAAGTLQRKYDLDGRSMRVELIAGPQR
jgi:chemotaxis protein CheX